MSQEVLHALVYELEVHSAQLMTKPALTITSAFDAVNAHLMAMCCEEQLAVRMPNRAA